MKLWPTLVYEEHNSEALWNGQEETKFGELAEAYRDNFVSKYTPTIRGQWRLLHSNLDLLQSSELVVSKTLKYEEV